MRILFSPQRRDGSLSLARQGDVLTINSEPFDFSGLPEGATLPASAVDCPFITGTIERDEDRLSIKLILPHGPNPSEAIAFPEPITVAEDGPIEVPQ